MKTTSQVQRRAIALAIATVGVLVTLLTQAPSALLVAVAAICIWLGWRAGLTAVAAASVFWTAIVAIEGTWTLRSLVFVGSAVAIWLLVEVFRGVSFYDALDQRSQRAVEDIPGLGWTAWPDGRMRFVNPAGLTYVGVTADEMNKIMDADDNHWMRFLHPDDAAASRERWDRMVKTGEPMIDEARVRRHDGVYRWFRDTIVPMRDRHGRITGWYGHTTDIDDQRKAEAALHQRERELQLLVDTVPTMIYLTNPEGRPYYFNKRFADWVGTDPNGEVVPKVGGDDPYAMYIHPDDREVAQAAFYGAFAEGKPLVYKARLRRSDGTFRWLDSRVEPLRDENGTIIRWYGVLIDIDDEVRAQEALRLADERLTRASQAASLSELSVSIAHELNQPLQAVVANANAFERWLAADPPNYERAGRAAGRIIRDANAAADVLHRIRSLFRQGSHERQLLDLNEIVTGVCELITDKLASNSVRLTTDLDPGLPRIMADRVQMEQVILNLMLNGMEAMETIEPRARTLRVLSRRVGEAIRIEVRDAGTGITDADRMFEPFYTTKEKGMGMGLSICRSIVESHAGRMSAESIREGGTAMSFTLPVHATDAWEADSKEAVAEET